MAEPTTLVEQPFTFGEMVKIHKSFQKEAPFFQNMDLPAFATFVGEQTGRPEMFQSGMKDSVLKRFSAGFNRLLEPVSRPSGEAFLFLGDLVGLPEHLREPWRQLGETAPRGFLETAGVIAGAAAGVSPLGLGLMALGAGSAGTHTLEMTDSGLAALATVGLTAAIPGFARLGRKLVGEPIVRNAFYQPIATMAKSGTTIYGPKVAGQDFAENLALYAGENVGLLVNQELAIQSESLLSGHGIVPLDDLHALQLVGGQVPFALLDLINLRRPTAVVDPKTGRRDNFRSNFHVEQFNRWFKEAGMAEYADAVNRFVHTKEASKPRGLLPAPGETGGPFNMPPSALAQRLFGGVLEIMNPPVPVEFQTYNKILLGLEPNQTVSAGGLQEAFGLKESEADAVLRRLVDRGFVKPAEPFGRFVVAEPPKNAMREVVDEAIATYFASTKDVVTTQPETPVKSPEASTVPLSPATSKQILEDFTRLDTVQRERKRLLALSKEDFAAWAATAGGREGGPTSTGETLGVDPGRYKEFLQQTVTAAEGPLTELRKLVHSKEFNTAQRESLQRGAELTRVARIKRFMQDPIEFVGEEPARGAEPPRAGAAPLGGDEGQNLGRLSKGTSSEQMVAQFLLKFEPQVVEETFQVPLTTDEKVSLLNGLTDKIRSVITDAVAGHSKFLEALKEPLTKGLDELLEMGVTPAEAANIVYLRAINRLGQSLKLLEEVDQATKARERSEEVVARENRLVERLNRLSELNEDEAHVLVEVLRDARLLYGYDTRGRNIAYPATVGQSYALAAGIAFRDNATSKRSGKTVQEEFIERVRSSKEAMQEVRLRPEWDGQIVVRSSGSELVVVPKNQERAVYLVALKQYALTRGLYRTDEAFTALQETQTETGGETTAAGKEVLEKLNRTVEEQAAYEAAEERAQQEAVTFRKLVPLKAYTPLEWNKARVAGGLDMLRRSIPENVGRLNKLLSLFYENQIGLVPDPKDLGKSAADAKIGWEEVGKQLELHPRAARLFFHEQFIPSMQGMVKLRLAEVEARTPRLEAATSRMSQAELEQKAERRGLDPIVETPSPHMGVAMMGAQKFFRKFFAADGRSPQEVEVFTNVAVKAVALFHDIGFTRIGEATGTRFEGLHMGMRRGELNALIGLMSRNEPYWGRYPKKFLPFRMVHLLTHELFHGMKDLWRSGRMDPVKAKNFDSVVKWANELGPEGRLAVMKYWTELIIPNRDIVEVAGMVQQRMEIAMKSSNEFLADFAAALSLGLISPAQGVGVKSFGAHLKFTGPREQAFAKAMFLPLHSVLGSVLSYVRSFKNVLGTEVLNVERLEHAQQNIVSVLKDVQFAEKAAEALKQIEQFDPKRYHELMAGAEVKSFTFQAMDEHFRDPSIPLSASTTALWEGAVQKTRKALGFVDRTALERELGVQPGWIREWFEPFAQLAKEFPQLQPVYDLVRSFRALANEAATRMLAPFMAKTGVAGRLHLDPDRAGLRMLSKNPHLDRVATDIGLAKQFNPERVMTDSEMRAMMPGLSEAEQLAVIDFHRALEHSMPVAADLIVKFETDKISLGAASLIMAKNRTLKAGQAERLGQELHTAFLLSLDPAGAASATVKLEAVRQAVGDEAFQSGLRFVQDLQPRLQQMTQQLLNRPGFIPELRLGKYIVAWKRADGTTGSMANDNFDVVLKKKEQLVAEGVPSVRMWDKYDKRNAMSGINPDLVERYRAIDEAAFRAAEKELGQSEDLETFKALYTPGEAVMREVKAQGVGRFLLSRKLAEGRETTSVSRGIIHYISGLSTGLAKAYTRGRAALVLADQDLTANPRLKELARLHIGNVIDPAYREQTAFKNLNFLMFLGYNLSSMLIEGSQSLLTLAPQLTRDSGSVASSYSYIGSALKELVKAVRTGKYDDAELDTAVRRARREQRIDFGIMQEFHDIDERVVPALRSLAMGTDTVLGKLYHISKPLHWYLKGARWLYSQATRANAHLAFVAAYKLAKTQMNATPDQAYTYAIKTLDAAMFGGGAANRPVKLFSSFGEAGGAVGVMYSLQTFTFSTIAMMARLGLDSIGRDGRLSSTEKKAARKAFGQMMLTQSLLGGAMSLPFVAGIPALLEQLFPELEVKRHLREGVNELVNTFVTDDEETGQLVSDIAMKGLPMGLGRTAVDISGRVGLSSLLGVNPYSGFQIGGLLGPIGGVFENLYKGVREFSRGEWGAGFESILPNAYKNLVRMHNDDWDVRDKAGRLLFEPNDAERVLYGVGLRPKRVSQFQEAAELTARSNEVEKLELDSFHKEVADTVETGNVNLARTMLLAKMQAEQLYDARAGAHRVAEILVDRSIPRDLTRTGARTGAQTRSRIGAALGQSPQAIEVQRLIRARQMASMMGIPGTAVLSGREVQRAAFVDQLMQVNPRMTRQEALAVLERAMGPAVGGLF